MQLHDHYACKKASFAINKIWKRDRYMKSIETFYFDKEKKINPMTPEHNYK